MASMVNTISDFIIKCSDFLNKFENNKNLRPELAYIVLNGLGEPFAYNKRSLIELIDCDIELINGLTNKVNLLLAAGFGILVICLLIICPYFLSVDAMTNSF